MKKCLHIPEKFDKSKMQWKCRCGAYTVSHVLVMKLGWNKVLGGEGWEKEQNENQS